MTIFNRKQRDRSKPKELQDLISITIQLKMIAQDLQDTNCRLSDQIQTIRSQHAKELELEESPDAIKSVSRGHRSSE